MNELTSEVVVWQRMEHELIDVVFQLLRVDSRVLSDLVAKVIDCENGFSCSVFNRRKDFFE